MAGFISFQFVAAPKDAWTDYRHALIWRREGRIELSNQILQGILDDPKVEECVKKQAAKQLEAARPMRSSWLDYDELIPF
jgi:hypothetical protein